MKKLSLFYTSRFLFNKGLDAFSGFPGGRPVDAGPMKPEAEKRSPAEVREARKAETAAVYSTQRDRMKALQSKKTVKGEKFEQKEGRVNEPTMVIKANGMPGRIDPMDHVKVLNGGQVYDMNGEKFVKVEVKGSRSYGVDGGGPVKLTDFTAYVPVEALREEREVEGEKLTNAYMDELQKYLDEVAKDRFYINTEDFSTPESGDGTQITVRDTENGNRIVSWAMLDVSTDKGGNFLDTVGVNAGSPVFRAREKEFGRQSAGTLVMGTSGYNPDATYQQDLAVRRGKVPEPDNRVRLGGPDTAHYSLPEALERAKREVRDYLMSNPTSGIPGPKPGDDDFVDDAVIEEAGLMKPDEK